MPVSFHQDCELPGFGPASECSVVTGCLRWHHRPDQIKSQEAFVHFKHFFSCIEFTVREVDEQYPLNRTRYSLRHAQIRYI